MIFTVDGMPTVFVFIRGMGRGQRAEGGGWRAEGKLSYVQQGRSSSSRIQSKFVYIYDNSTRVRESGGCSTIFYILVYLGSSPLVSSSLFYFFERCTSA